MLEGARLATASDLGALAELARTAAAVLADARGGALFIRREGSRVDAQSILESALADPERLLITGVIDEVVLGYAAVSIDDLHDGGRLGRIDDLYVEPEARTVGVGEAMMAMIVEWCRGRECVGIDAMALPGERLTKNFFEAAGFTARLIIQHKKLSP